MPRSRSRSPSHSGDHSRPYRNRNRDRDRTERRNSQPHSHSHRTTHTHTHSRPHHHHHHHRSRRRHHSRSPPPVLPRNAQRITKHDFDAYKSLFAEYLNLQKGLNLAELSEREAQGRYRRFVTHWNRGELAKGWYDPSRKDASATQATTTATTTTTSMSAEEASSRFLDSLDLDRRKPLHADREESGDGAGDGGGGGGDGGGGSSSDDASSSEDDKDDDDNDDEIVGPLPPGYEAPGVYKRGKQPVATMPTLEDLDLQKEQLTSSRLASTAALRASRRADRALQKEQLDDILPPRPPPGSHEAKIEKKKLLNEKLRPLRDNSPDMDIPDAEIMGGSGGAAGGGTDSFKQLKAAKERKKNERELRKEAILRQRMEEREGRLRMHREKEERTIAMLRALAESAQRGGGR